jgi:two-component system sensor histidine kinase KdpD
MIRTALQASQHSGAAPLARGRYKIFLGMAAGVGKTYRMLQEGQAEGAAGRDVVIGYLEPHGRAETLAQAVGLEVVPRRRVCHRSAVLEEMNLPAVMTRAPDLCLIDELAHTNAPGTEHPKRYEDIADVLAAGIDVYSTVNVQHLESLNDQIAESTGVRVRETVPDSALASADDVVLIDVTPDSLIERLIAGKVYPADRVQTALNSFFRIENLSALREVALRQVAEEVEHKRYPAARRGEPGAWGERLGNDAASAAIGERLLALVTPDAGSQRIVRRAWRSAQRLGAELDILCVSRERLAAEQEEQLQALRRLASVLGAHMIVEHGQDVVLVTQRVAPERGTTYVLMGAPTRRHGIRGLFRPDLPTRLLDLLPGVDLRLVADRTRRRAE